jgi:predicted dehydrogenase
MIKLGVIGLGHMGGYHLSALSLIPSVKIIGVADPCEKNLLKARDISIQKSINYHDWLDSVTAVVIAVPTEHHYAIAKDCLEHKKHVFVEKPLTKTTEEAHDLLSYAREHNLTLHIGHIERFNGAVQELKKIINEPFLIESHRMGPFVPRVQRDSVVLDLMIHDLDIVLNLVESPVKDFSVQGRRVYSDSCDIASVQLLFENGVIANIISSRASQVKMRTMVIHQKSEFIQLDFTTQDIFIHRQGASSVQVGADQLRYKQEALIERLFVYKENAIKLELEYFINAVKSGNNRVNLEQDISALALAIDIEKRLGLR